MTNWIYNVRLGSITFYINFVLDMPSILLLFSLIDLSINMISENENFIIIILALFDSYVVHDFEYKNFSIFHGNQEYRKQVFK